MRTYRRVTSAATLNHDIRRMHEEHGVEPRIVTTTDFLGAESIELVVTR